MLHLMAFPVVGFLVGLVVVLGGRPQGAGRAAGLAGGVVGGCVGGWLLYHGGAAGHHRFLSLVSAALLGTVASAVADRLGRSTPPGA